MADFNFRTVTSKFNKLVYKFPIRFPEVAYPYVARRLLTDEDPQLRQRLTQVLFKDDDLREQVLNALTEGNRLHLEEVQEVLQALEGRIDPQKVVESLPQIGRKVVLGWADKILSS